MGKKKYDPADDDRVLDPDFPLPPPPPPEGGWRSLMKERYPYDISRSEDSYAPLPPDPVDIRRFCLRVGKIRWAMAHPLEPDRLVLTYVDIDDDYPLPLVSSIGKYYSKEQLEGRKVVALVNIEPVVKRNIGNTAMLMCATAEDGRHELWSVPKHSKAGEYVHAEGYYPVPANLSMCPQAPFMRNRDGLFEQIIPDLSVDAERHVVYQGTNKLFVKGRLGRPSRGYVTTETLASCAVKTTFV